MASPYLAERVSMKMIRYRTQRQHTKKWNIRSDHNAIRAKYDDTKGDREWYSKFLFSIPLKKPPTAVQNVDYACFETD
jgi:hypothetical protein